MDNARLALELLLKELLCNKKSLEKQHEDLGRKLKVLNVPVEIRNRLSSSLKDYTAIQNNHSKHNTCESLTELEVNFVLNDTHMLTKYLIQKLKRKETYPF